MRRRTKKRNGLREIPDDLWELIEPILPPDKPPGSNGRPRAPNRTVLNGILFVCEPSTNPILSGSPPVR